ncbi:RsiV family protein [Pollutimonas sp. M17]|uniref:RsiV family protein n=1 Tax=Pollutimonas sp. M17 TaxID=2962065 RepID=UPI0021F483C2|nr:RsiV family protein [Pollutimonas sp. M17]UYO95386.1 RsiV family protein [Pollutimonas sp. M17]HWK70357.1 RsiV family protein [Burkholderiaceae bacterium]
MSISPFLFPRVRRAALLSTVVFLSACASGPKDNISLIPAETAQQSGKEGLFTQEVKWERRKPGCTGDCPTLKLDSIVFPGQTRLNELIDHALATMTGVDSSAPPYATVQQYQDYFWKTAAPRDSTLLAAKTRYRNRHLTVVELNTWQYYTGAAHGISATQFLNWDNDAGRVLGLADILEPGKGDDYVAALRAAHQRWLATNPDAQNDPDTYHRIWPFQVSSNFGFTDQGLVVKYDSYLIAPYSSGQPELLMPYSELRGILKPAYMPA